MENGWKMELSSREARSGVDAFISGAVTHVSTRPVGTGMHTHRGVYIYLLTNLTGLRISVKKLVPVSALSNNSLRQRPSMINEARELLCQGRFPASLIYVLIVSTSPAVPSTFYAASLS